MPKVTIDRSNQKRGQRFSGVSGVDLGTGVGAGLKSLGDSLFSIGSDIKQKELQAQTLDYVSNKSIELTTQVYDIHERMQQETDNFEGYTNKVLDQVKPLFKEAIDGAPTDEAKNILLQNLSSKQQALFKDLKGFEREQRVTDFANNFQNSVSMLSNQLQRTPGNFDLLTKQFEELKSTLPSFLSKKQADKLTGASQTALANSFIKGLIDNGAENEATAILNSGQLDTVLGSNAQRSLKASAEVSKVRKASQLEKVAKQEYKQFTDAIDLEILDTQMGTADLSLADLGAHFSQGHYDDPQDYIKHVNKLTGVLGKQLDRDEVTNLGEELLTGSALADPFNKDHKEAINVAYEDRILPTLSELPPQERLNTIVDMVRKTSVVPDQLMSQLRGNLINGSPSQQVDSATTLKALIKEKPTLANTINDDTLARVNIIAAASKSARTPEEAVGFIDFETAQEGTTQFKIREQKYKSAAEFDPDKLDSLFVAQPGTVPSSLEAEYYDTVRNFIVGRNMEPEQAEEAAYERLKATWGITEINGGTNRFQKHPPEAVYGHPDIDNKWMTQQLRSSLTELGTVPSELVDEVFLEPIPQTVQGRTVYSLSYVDDDGSVVSVQNEDGSLVGWWPDITQTEDWDKLNAEKEERTQVLKDRRQVLLDAQQEMLSLKETETRTKRERSSLRRRIKSLKKKTGIKE